MKKQLIAICLLAILSTSTCRALAATTGQMPPLAAHPIEALLGEELSYDISFLWFKRLAVGTIRLTPGQRSGTYLAVLEAETLGLAAFLTKDRVERLQTLMEIGPDGLLRPLEFSTFSLKGRGEHQREKVTSYIFDHTRRQVKYLKVKDHVIRNDETLPLETGTPVFDVLSAFYNLRSGVLGPLDGEQISLPTYHRRGIEDIVVAPVDRGNFQDNDFFSADSILRKVLIDPEIFKASGGDLFVSFDHTGRPQRAIVKNVIGLGDVRGILRQPELP